VGPSLTIARLVLSVAALSACSPTVPPHAGQPTTANIRDSVRAGVLSVLSAEERYFSDANTYTVDTALLRVLADSQGVPIPSGVVVTVLIARPFGYALEGTHPRFAGRSCVLLASDSPEIPAPKTRLEGLTPVPSGLDSLAVVCDRP